MTAPSELFAAIRTGDEGGVEALLASDPGLAAARDPDGLSAVMLARYFSWSDLAIVDRLVAARGEDRLDVFEAAATGRVARLRALIHEDPRLVAARSVDGFTPLHLAAFFGSDVAAELLLDAGADPEAVAQNEQLVQPLHSALAGGAFAVARRLVDAGADVDAPQQAGFRPLHAAAQNGDELTVDLLLLAGADPRATADDGRRAADFAAERGHAALAERLRAAALTD
ncbi:MAG TPA: ankyrin repeat domain-containing protein [Candidatus Dormibacteraeota bacterium]|nr:ankyrin repeat domain-containing protein [Candidatus Dormibacteraeota bacterium]